MGINDVTNGRHHPMFGMWRGILERCYASYKYGHKETYKDCIVDPDWLHFSKFLEWCENPSNGYQNGYHLDKDILIKGNRVYSPNSCCFVPREINDMFIGSKSKRNGLPIGVRFQRGNKSRYEACTIQRLTGEGYVHIGTYGTPIEAFIAYKSVRESYIQKVAKDYYNNGKITLKVYYALMNYRVEMSD